MTQLWTPPPQQIWTPPQGPPVRRAQGLSGWVHAWAKYGKSSFGDSGPRPALILDVEGSAYWTPSRKIYWDPAREPVPQPPGRHLTAGYGKPSQTPEWESAIALIREARQVYTAHDILASGAHPFNSASLDSVTEIQQRMVDDLTRGKAMDRDKWGALLRDVNNLLRKFRDLINNPVRPLWSVVFISGTRLDTKIGKLRPLIQGQASDYLPYYPDFLGFIDVAQDGARILRIGPSPYYETGERLGGRLPDLLPLAYPGRSSGWTMETMLLQVLQNTGR